MSRTTFSRKLSLFLLLALVGFFQPVNAQESFIHLDKSFYVNGEVIWYKMYLPKSFGTSPRVVKAVILNKAGREMDYVFHKVDEFGQVSGYYKVPFDMPTGMYRLAFRTLDITQLTNQELGSRIFPVYNDNDLRALQEQMVELPEERRREVVEMGNELEVRLSIDPVNPGVRDQLNLRIQVSDPQGNGQPARASVAITDWGQVEPALGFYSGVTQGENLAGLNPDNLAGKWYKRIKSVDEAGKARMTSVIGVWSSDENRMFFSRRTNAEGVSLLELPEFKGEKTIQFLGFQKEVDQLRTESIREQAEPIAENMLITPGLLTYLEKSQKRKKIFQYYGQLEFDLRPEPQELDIRELKGNQSYRIQDYESFDNFATFFQENLSPLRFLEDRDNNRYIAYIYNPRNNRGDNRYEGRPLFIIDGKATRNSDFVGRLDLGPIEDVQLFFRPENMREYFNVMGSSGVVTVSLTGEDEIQLPAEDEANRYRVNGIQQFAEFPAFDPEQTGGQQPFFRPQLFWAPDVVIPAGAGTSLPFTHSDATGIFRIEVFVQDAAGRRGYQTLMYEVPATRPE